jgi:hypothetical protein
MTSMDLDAPESAAQRIPTRIELGRLIREARFQLDHAKTPSVVLGDGKE